MLFDPTTDFSAQTAQAQQARAYADLLRKQAMQQQTPQGQMVSGHYVTPHWTQYLGGIMDKLNAGWQDSTATNAEQSLANAQSQAASQWRAGLPESTAAQPQQTAPFMAPGMDGQENIPGTSMITQQAAPYKPVPTAVRLKHTLAGLANPATAKEAMVWNQGMAEETTREDNQQAKREALVAQLEARREEALRRSEDMRLTREQQAELRREALQAQKQIAEMNNATRRDMAALAAGTQRSIAEMRGSGTDKRQDRIDKQLPVLAEKTREINPLISAGQTLQNLFDTHGDKPIAGFGYAGKLPGQLLSAQGNANRAALKSFTNAIMRANAGLSQTIAEQHNVNLETLADGNYTEKEIRKVWPILREKANDALKGITAGFEPEAVETYKSRGGLVSPIASKKAAGGATGGWKIEEAK